MVKTDTYLLPENVAATNAQMVLDFLNEAKSAEEIASAVEIPGELDIGLKVSARILRQRDRLDGFTSLEQVYAVPYVGPERFTELIISLSAMRPPQVFDDQPDPSLLNQIAQRLNVLEEQLPTCPAAAPSIRLQAINPDILLGQEMIILAELQGSDGWPLIDQELTVVTTWGLLSGRAGFRTVEGNSVTVRSDHLGLCRLRLSASLGDALTSIETSSLHQALALLATATENPRDNMLALTELARRYRAPGNASLRRAIDVYFKGYGDSSFLNAPVDSLMAWPRIAMTVIAWLPPESGLATTQLPTTILNVQQRNWFYSWLWAYRQLLDSETQLVASLTAVDGDKRSGSGILSDIFSRVGGFVKAQDGLVGQQLGHEFAANSLNFFLQSGLNKFPLEERSKIITGVTSGVKSLSSTQAFSTLQTSRTDVNMQIDSRIANIDSSTKLNDLDSRISLIEKSAITSADLTALRTGVLTAAIKETTLLLNEMQRDVSKALSIKASITDLKQLENKLADRMRSKADISRINQLENNLNETLDRKADIAQMTRLNKQVATLNDTTKSLRGNLKEINTSVNLRIDKLSTGGRIR